jgi:hypothetical protein
MAKTQHIIINGDSRNMSKLQDKSVHLIITTISIKTRIYEPKQ